MTDESAAFAAWILGLLPRLALWPGGVALVLAGGWAWWARRQPGGAPTAWSSLDRLALALAWVAVALLPLPGAAPLPLAPDALVLLGLLLAAAGLAGGDTRSLPGLGLCAGAVAILAAGAGSFVLPFASIPLPVTLLAALAYAWGLASQADATRRPLPAALHLLLWLGWVGLAGSLPSPGNLLAGSGTLFLLLALVGLPLPALWAHRTAWIGGLALAAAVAALLLA